MRFSAPWTRTKHLEHRAAASDATPTAAERRMHAPQDLIDLTFRLEELRADLDSGYISHAEFVEQRLRLLERRRRSTPYTGTERRRRVAWTPSPALEARVG